MINACPLCCYITLSNGSICAVDPADWVRLRNYTWIAKKGKRGWYAIRKVHVQGRTQTIYMHREIAKPAPIFEIHHKNGNTLDNRRTNLQVIGKHTHKLLHRTLRISRRRISREHLTIQPLTVT